MSYRYSRYIAHVMRHPWAILPEKLAMISELVRERAAGHKPSDEEIAARLNAETERCVMPAARSDGAVAVIPIHGVVAHRADSFDASSGGTSTELIGRLLQRAVADDSIKGIVLDISSPGGSVEGVPELARQIAQATAVKPVVAHVNALGASAAYWLASQASELVITPSGMAGSIGVFMILIDESEALANEGIKINAISAGDYKLEGAPWEPLSDEARAHYQSQVDAVYRDFVSSVSRGRGVTTSDVKKQFGQGRMYDAKEALARGMVDRIATFDDTLARLMGGGRQRMPGGRAAAYVFANTLPTLPIQTEAIVAPKVPPDEDGNCPEGYEKNDEGMCHAAEDVSACAACGGSGLKPERYMGDPQGQESCPECGGSGKKSATVTQTGAGTALLESLPLFTGPRNSIGIVMLHRGADGQTRLEGEWPARTAFTTQVLDEVSPMLQVDGQDIHLRLANASATYRAIGYRDGDEIVADRGYWVIQVGSPHTETSADTSQAHADRDAVAVAVALTE